MKRLAAVILAAICLAAADPAKPPRQPLTESDRLSVRELQLRIARIQGQKAALEAQYRNAEALERSLQEQLDALVEKLRPAGCDECVLRDDDLVWEAPETPAPAKPTAPPPAETRK